MPPVFGMVISNKLATLRELKEFYTYSECLDLLDIARTDNYNKAIMMENRDKSNGR